MCVKLGKDASVYEILSVFFRRISLLMINKDTISVFINCVTEKKIDGSTRGTAEMTMKQISKIFPALFKTQLETLFSLIMQEENMKIVTDAVETLSKFVKEFPDLFNQKEFLILI